MDKPQENESSGEEMVNADTDLQYERLNMNFWVNNKTSKTFIVEDFGLAWGKWMENPRAIRPSLDNQLPFRSCGRAHSPSGTEGWVRFSSDSSKVKFTVRWEVSAGTHDGYLTIGCEGEACNSYRFDVTHYDPRRDDPNPILTISAN